MEPGQEGALHPGRHRQRQRQQHDPGRLQLLVPAAARGPNGRQARRQPRPDAPTTSSTGRCSRPRRPASRSARTSPGGSPPTSRSAPSSTRGPAGASAAAPALAGPRRLRDGEDHATSARSSPRTPTTTTRAPSGRATCSGARRRSRWPTRRCTPRPGSCSADLQVAARWAGAYIAQGHPAGGDTLNLYDNGAIAEAELLQAMRQAPPRPVDRARRRCSATSPRSCGWASAGRRATRSSWARPSAPATPRRTRSACTSPTRCTSGTAARTPTGRSRSSS